MRPARQISLNTVTVIAGAALFFALVMAGVALGLAGWEPAAILGFLTGLAGLGAIVLPFLDKLINVGQETRNQTATLNTINRRVNGELDARISSVVEEALTRHFGPRPREDLDQAA